MEAWKMEVLRKSKSKRWAWQTYVVYPPGDSLKQLMLIWGSKCFRSLFVRCLPWWVFTLFIFLIVHKDTCKWRQTMWYLITIVEVNLWIDETETALISRNLNHKLQHWILAKFCSRNGYCIARVELKVWLRSSRLHLPSLALTRDAISTWPNLHQQRRPQLYLTHKLDGKDFLSPQSYRVVTEQCVPTCIGAIRKMHQSSKLESVIQAQCGLLPASPVQACIWECKDHQASNPHFHNPCNPSNSHSMSLIKTLHLWQTSRPNIWALFNFDKIMTLLLPSCGHTLLP